MDKYAYINNIVHLINALVFFRSFQSPCDIAPQIHAGKIPKSAHLVDYKVVILKTKNSPPRPLQRSGIGNSLISGKKSCS